MQIQIMSQKNKSDSPCILARPVASQKWQEPSPAKMRGREVEFKVMDWQRSLNPKTIFSIEKESKDLVLALP